jgi:hypothetical protein
VTETEVAFAPTRVGARRRRLPPVVVGLSIVVLLVLAVAKPWGSALDPAGSPDASTSAAVAIASGSASGPPGAPYPSGDPSPDPNVAAPTPVAFPGPPRPGAWGVSVGLDTTGDTTGAWAMWSEWVPLDPVSERPEPPIRDPLPIGTDCSSVPTLSAAPSILGITVPEAMSTDFSVLGWLSNGPWTEPLDGELARLDVPGKGQVASVARRDGLTFPDGRYELHLLTADHVTALGFCLDSRASPGPVAAAPDPAITAQIVHDLSDRAGAWGVGAGGNGPRLVREEPWTDWAAVDPGPAWNGTSLTLWPDTGLCLGAPALLSHPSLMAITVPPGLVPDWTVAAFWQDGSGIRSLAGLVRQISPAGNRGIAYLERVDHAPWPVGRYEFDVLAGDHRSSLTACINGK